MGCGQTKSLVQDFSMGGGREKKEDDWTSRREDIVTVLLLATWTSLG